MSKPAPKPEEKKPSETVDTPDGGIEVSIEEEVKPVVVEEQEPAPEVKPEVKVDTQEDKLKKQLYYSLRQQEKQQKEIDELKKKMSEPAAVTRPVIEDDIDKLAEKDWKAAVNKLAEQKAREILLSEQQRIQKEKEAIETQTRMDSNVQTVVGKHSELNDPLSEKAVIFQEILNKNPHWRTSPDGPLLTMYEMENELRKRGFDVDGNMTEKVKEEQERLTRANASSLMSSRKAPTPNKIALTREQKEFCDMHGLSYENYAKTLKSGMTEVQI